MLRTLRQTAEGGQGLISTICSWKGVGDGVCGELRRNVEYAVLAGAPSARKRGVTVLTKREGTRGPTGMVGVCRKRIAAARSTSS